MTLLFVALYNVYSITLVKDGQTKTVPMLGKGITSKYRHPILPRSLAWVCTPSSQAAGEGVRAPVCGLLIPMLCGARSRQLMISMKNVLAQHQENCHLPYTLNTARPLCYNI